MPYNAIVCPSKGIAFIRPITGGRGKELFSAASNPIACLAELSSKEMVQT